MTLTNNNPFFSTVYSKPNEMHHSGLNYKWYGTQRASSPLAVTAYHGQYGSLLHERAARVASAAVVARVASVANVARRARVARVAYTAPSTASYCHYTEHTGDYVAAYSRVSFIVFPSVLFDFKLCFKDAILILCVFYGGNILRHVNMEVTIM